MGKNCKLCKRNKVTIILNHSFSKSLTEYFSNWVQLCIQLIPHAIVDKKPYSSNHAPTPLFPDFGWIRRPCCQMPSWLRMWYLFHRPDCWGTGYDDDACKPIIVHLFTLSHLYHLRRCPNQVKTEMPFGLIQLFMLESGLPLLLSWKSFKMQVYNSIYHYSFILSLIHTCNQQPIIIQINVLIQPYRLSSA